MAESSSYSLVHRILEIVNVITSIGDFKTHKKECNILTRRVKLLVPIFEEARDMRLSFSGEGLECIDALEAALTTAKVLLLLCNEGSKLYLVTFRLFKTFSRSICGSLYLYLYFLFVVLFVFHNLLNA